MARKEYQLTQEQFDELMAASQPVPYMVVGGAEPTSPQQMANMAWKKLGDELGFHYLTVEPAPGKDAHFFIAEPKSP